MLLNNNLICVTTKTLSSRRAVSRCWREWGDVALLQINTHLLHLYSSMGGSLGKAQNLLN